MIPARYESQISERGSQISEGVRKSLYGGCETDYAPKTISYKRQL